MPCLKPISIPGNKINAPCGRCINCLQKKRSDWTIRALEEYKICDSAYFVTLTYQEKYLPYVRILESMMEETRKFNMRKKDPVTPYLHKKSWNLDPQEIQKWIDDLNGMGSQDLARCKTILKRLPTLNKKDLQNYFKRIRTTNKRLKYFAVGEYGGKGRPHYHAIMFNVKDQDILDKWTSIDYETGEVEEIGNVKIGEVNQSSIHYLTKYLINDEFRDNRIRAPFQVSSKGFGINYTSLLGDHHRNNISMEYTTQEGKKLYLPRYYKEKIFTEQKHKEAIKLKYSYIAEQNHEEILSQTPEFRAEQRKKAKFKARKSSKSKGC